MTFSNTDDITIFSSEIQKALEWYKPKSGECAFDRMTY